MAYAHTVCLILKVKSDTLLVVGSSMALSIPGKVGTPIFGISEPIFYGELVYQFKQIVGKPNFSDQFKKIVKPYIRVGLTWISCDSLHA